MEKSWSNLATALAGVVQHLHQVEQLAKTGYLNSELFETAVFSLFQRAPTSVDAVFGGLPKIDQGLEVLVDLLAHHRDPKNADILRYLLGVLHLQKKLSRRKDLLDIIGSRLERAEQQATHFGYTHDNVVSHIAEIYTDTISKFQYRIQVTGEYNYLQQQRVANQIRVLLLATIRAATLWRQLGGSRWQLLFYRTKISAAAIALRSRGRLH